MFFGKGKDAEFSPGVLGTVLFEFLEVVFDVAEVLIEVGFVVGDGFVGKPFVLEGLEKAVEELLVGGVETAFFGIDGVVVEVVGGVGGGLLGGSKVGSESS